MGGFFVTDGMLRANDERKITYLLAKAPRLQQLLSDVGTDIFLAVPGPLPMDLKVKADPEKRYDRTKCYVNVYMNGARYWTGPPDPNNLPPNFDELWAREYSGIEYYASSATIPSQYNSTNRWPCGVLLLWTRR
jgi:hypothetical protein